MEFRMTAPTRATRRLLQCVFLLLLLQNVVSAFSLPGNAGLIAYNSQPKSLPSRTSSSHRLLVLKPDDQETISTSSQSSNRGAALVTALGSLSSVTLAAKMGLLGDYPDATIVRDLGAAVLCGILGFVYVKAITWLASKSVLPPRDARKLVHVGSAPLYMLFWPLFSSSGRYFAACVPLINAVRLFLAATGEANESELAYAVSRSGDAKEALGGPFLYVVIMFFSILLFWTSNGVGITAMCIMAAGDGMADIIGRRLGKNNKWPFAPDKSIAGSVAFWVAGTGVTLGILLWLSHAGSLTSLSMPMSELAVHVACITAACAFIELLPLGDDNWTVPLSAAILSSIFLL